MRPVIQIQHLSKRYRLGSITPKTALEDFSSWSTRKAFSRSHRTLLRQTRSDNLNPQYMWALRDINLQIDEGEIVGIVGRNGAGKSTMLKLLSRITAPTKGTIKLRGRLASLLEIGTGFHPELTGRENIFLNGSILGMQSEEIRKNFDEIVAFAEVEPYIDTPVKRYSSGMHVRLAFSVAAHLQSDVLIVDEVLAVGDVAFQKKCLSKMGDAAQSGRTVLFVSHRMDHITSLCRRSVLLNSGRLEHDGGTAEALARYYAIVDTDNRASLRVRPDRRGRGRVRVVDAVLRNSQHQRTQTIVTGDNFFISLVIENQTADPIHELIAEVEIRSFGNLLTATMTSDLNDKKHFTVVRQTTVEFAVARLPLNSGHFSMNVRLSHADGEDEDVVEDALPIVIDFGDYHGVGQSSGGFLSIQQEVQLGPDEVRL